MARVYQVHSATPESGVLDDASVLADLAALRADGVAVGVTVSGTSQGQTLAPALELGLFDVVQATWNLHERAAEPELVRTHARGVRVYVKEALANGRLAGREPAPALEAAARAAGTTPDALALAAVLARPWADVVLSGAATVDTLCSNLRATAVAWTPELDPPPGGPWASRWSWRTRPGTTASTGTPTSRTWTAPRCWPCPSRAAARCGAVLVLENRLVRGAFSPDRLDVVRLIAGQLAVSLNNAQLYAELTASRGRIVAAADEARRRVERDLHDGAQQRLVQSVVGLKLAQAALAGEEAQATELVADALENARLGMQEIREMARGIHPRILSSGGLGPALKAVAGRSPIPVRLDLLTGGRLDEHVEVTAYYVASERSPTRSSTPAPPPCT